jgi:hypothetical protein
VLLPGCHGVGSVAGAATREADRIGYLVLISQQRWWQGGRWTESRILWR